MGGRVHIHASEGREAGVVQPLLHGSQLDSLHAGVVVRIAGYVNG